MAQKKKGIAYRYLFIEQNFKINKKKLLERFFSIKITLFFPPYKKKQSKKEKLYIRLFFKMKISTLILNIATVSDKQYISAIEV